MKTDMIGWSIIIILVILIASFTWFIIMEPIEGENIICAEAMNANYSFWDEYEGKNITKEYLNDTNFACR